MYQSFSSRIISAHIYLTAYVVKIARVCRPNGTKKSLVDSGIVQVTSMDCEEMRVDRVPADRSTDSETAECL